MNSAIPVLAAVAAGASVTYALIRMYLARSAYRAAEDAVDDFGAELSLAMRGGAERYTTPMPTRDGYLRERDASGHIHEILVGQLETARLRPITAKLTREFTAECRSIGFRARKAKDDLVSQAFWAQFHPDFRLSINE